MESTPGPGLRVNSAVSASTSCSSVAIARTLCRFNIPGKRPTLRSSPSLRGGSRFPEGVASLQGLSKVNGNKLSATKVEGSKIKGSTIEKASELLKGERKAEELRGSDQTLNKAVLIAIATVALAAQKQRWHEELASKIDVPLNDLRQGRLVESGCVYRQTFVIRSYEVGVNKTASIETLMNLFQEAALNHVWVSGLAGDGFGATHAMMKMNLIWVVTRMQVQIERYPEWGEAVEVDTWVMASGKNGMRRDWWLRDYRTGQILARATSTWVMMNRCTRRLSKLPDEVRAEVAPHFLERSALLEENVQKISKLGDGAQFIRTDLTPRLSDLDMNHHVNNVKYIGWILESLPAAIVEAHDLTDMILEYRRECGQSDVVESMTSPEPGFLTSEGDLSATAFPYSPLISGSTSTMTTLKPTIGHLQYTHLLRLQTHGAEIVRGRTVWRLKQQL